MARKREQTFGQVAIGDHFLYQGQIWQATMVIKGCCAPDWNVLNTETQEMSYLNGYAVVEILETLKCHPDSKDAVLELRPKAVIIDDPQLPILSKEVRVTPLITDRFVEYEDTDTWLLYFGLATRKFIPHYEKYERGQWIPQG